MHKLLSFFRKNESVYDDSTLASLHPKCITLGYVSRNNIHVILHFSTSLSVNIGSGIRVAIEVDNEVTLVCKGVRSLAENSTE